MRERERERETAREVGMDGWSDGGREGGWWRGRGRYFCFDSLNFNASYLVQLIQLLRKLIHEVVPAKSLKIRSFLAFNLGLSVCILALSYLSASVYSLNEHTPLVIF